MVYHIRPHTSRVPLVSTLDYNSRGSCGTPPHAVSFRFTVADTRRTCPSWSIAAVGVTNRTRTKAKTASPTLVVGHAVQRRRCLHGLCHGFQWPWLTSPVLSASPAVARARRALNHLHPLVTSGSANNSVCFLRVHSSSWPCPRYSQHLILPTARPGRAVKLKKERSLYVS